MAMTTVVFVLCIFVVLNASASDATRLLLNKTATGNVSREKIERYLLENGLGQTPPMG